MIPVVWMVAIVFVPKAFDFWIAIAALYFVSMVPLRLISPTIVKRFGVLQHVK
jgi:hypothetical protein